MIDSPEHDTQLARILHDQRRLDLETLRGLLGEARATRPRRGPTLARLLVERGLMPPEEASRWLSSALARPHQPGPPSGRFHVGAPVPAPPAHEQGEEASPGSAREGWFAGGRVDRFLIEERIGQGGMGAVFAALDEETGERVALKTLTPEAVEDEDLVARFLRETEAQAKVDAHPNVVRIHALGQAAGRPYAVMELIEGADLHERLRAGPLPPAEAARMARDLARGLAYLHARGVVHRDLKPANILFDADGTPKLVDFGMAWFAGASQLTRTGQVVGTPAYMAPEQARSQAGVGPWTDVYGLCAVLFAALTGRPPFQAEGMLPTLTKVLEEEPPAPSSLVPDLPPRLEEICLGGLAKDPDARPSAEELGKQLQRFLGGGGPGAASGSAGTTSGGPPRVPLLAGLAALLMVGAGVWLALRPAPRPAPGDVASSPPSAADPTPAPTPRPPPPPGPAPTPPAAPAPPQPEAPRAWTLGGEQRVEFALRIERPGAEGGYEQRWELSLRPAEGADPEHLAWVVRVDRLRASSRGPGGTSSWDSDQEGDPFAAARGRELGLRLRRDTGAVEELSGTEQLQEQIWAALPDKDDADQRLHTRLYLRGEDSFRMRLDRLLRVFPPPLAQTEPWSSERPAEPLQKLPVVPLRFQASSTGDQVEVRWQGERERVGALRGRRIEGQAVLREGELVRSEATEAWIGPPGDLRLTSSWRRLD